ncbi:ethylbenzene dehydrogenase-related protein [Thermogutta sp.]|uniref:ethylbenzene dehydrogenase-related protein n=1 Tax=Thermogutta sp. TaxID=1962930 RepID=UPI00321F99DE
MLKLRLPLTLLVGAAVIVGGCRRHAVAPPPQEIQALLVKELPTDPTDSVWRQTRELRIPLLLQDLVEPRLLQPSTSYVAVRALYDGRRFAFRLEWEDATENADPGIATFSDACAVQLPQKVEAVLPAPQMGEKGHPVEITLWKAVWKKGPLLEKGIQAVYPNAAVDHYPFQAASLVPGATAQQEMALRYSPARRLGNDVASVPEKGAQDIMAEGPGTITPLQKNSQAQAVRTAQGWAVVIVRDPPAGFSPDSGTHVAFAIWDGAHQETGSRKMRSAWVPLHIVQN